MKNTYKVEGKYDLSYHENLIDAMEHAKIMNEFVTITGPDFEVCGKFGVDSVKDGLCPDGIEYEWKKRR